MDLIVVIKTFISVTRKKRLKGEPHSVELWKFILGVH
jgi:hypothetical protein